MYRRWAIILMISLFSAARLSAALAVPGQQAAAPQIFVLDRDGNPLTTFTDGDVIRLRARLNAPSPTGQTMRFFLDQPSFMVGQCAIPANQAQCDTAPFFSLGWYWGFDQTPGEQRTLLAGLDPSAIQAKLSLAIKPRPVVLVHGFVSNPETWRDYDRPQGFLDSIGLKGYAVGDGQVPGALNTGSLDAPLKRTNTLLENAAILQQYIDGVKRKTGAQMVDLVVHSMGGMISRVYIDRYMGTDKSQGFRYLPGQERDVAQLIMLGSPSLGSDCAVLPSALGWYLPASLEIRSAYARQVANPQFTHRHGVSFFAIAGVPLIDPVASPCTPVPSDSVVSKDSVAGVPLELWQVKILHSSMTFSQQIFDDFVRPLLQKSPAEFSPQADPPGAAPDVGFASGAPVDAQFSQVFTGHVQAGQPAQVVIPIDAGVSVAGFAMFDPTHTLTVTVTGASGNVINLDPVKNGVLKIDDPASMIQLGYGFNNPKPGQWRVQINPTANTPANGTDYAITARFVGGALLRAYTDAVVAKVGQPVNVFARLEANGISSIPLESAEARVKGPSGDQPALPLQPSGDSYAAHFIPQEPGLYAVDVVVKTHTADGTPVERTGFLVVQVEQSQTSSGNRGRLALLGVGVGMLLFCALGVLFLALVWMWVRGRRGAAARV